MLGVSPVGVRGNRSEVGKFPRGGRIEPVGSSCDCAQRAVIGHWARRLTCADQPPLKQQQKCTNRELPASTNNQKKRFFEKDSFIFGTESYKYCETNFEESFCQQLFFDSKCLKMKR